jgi:hypothetical protein
LPDQRFVFNRIFTKTSVTRGDFKTPLVYRLHKRPEKFAPGMSEDVVENKQDTVVSRRFDENTGGYLRARGVL